VLTYRVEHLGYSADTRGHVVRLAFDDGTVLYGGHPESADLAVDDVLRRVEAAGSPAAYRARISQS
jgi:hypothetical protein